MARRSSPGQPKIPRRPTASERSRRQRARKMQAQQLDQEVLVREKPSEPTIEAENDIVAGHSGTLETNIGDSTTQKISIDDYKKNVQIDNFKVSDQPQFLASDNEDADIDEVQSKFGRILPAHIVITCPFS